MREQGTWSGHEEVQAYRGSLPALRNLTSFVRYATIITGQADLGPGRMFRVGKCLVLDVVTSNAAKRATK